jgi:hypothetical protein
MAAKLTRLTHKITIQLHIVAESCTICSSRSRRLVWKLLDIPSYLRRTPRTLTYLNSKVLASLAKCVLHWSTPSHACYFIRQILKLRLSLTL